MSEIITVQDLETLKKHEIFEAEVLTGKVGGLATGFNIDYATNPVTGQVQKTMPAILRGIGFTPVAFDFTSGGTLGVNDRDKAVLWPLPGGDGDWYYWEGALPKVIPPASSPASTGGVANGAWRPVGDITLRGDLALGTGAELVGTSAGGTVQDSLDTINHFVITGTFATGGTATANISALKHSDGYYYTPKTGSITVPAGSSPNSSWKNVGLLNGYGLSDVRNWTTNLADISGNNTKLQLMADSLGAGATIIFPAGTTTSFDKIDITNKNVTISGSGYIDGTLRVYSGVYAVSTDIYMNFKVCDECRFKTSRGLDAAIQLCYLRIASIGFSQCDGFTHCIRKLSTAELPNPSTIGQNVNRVTVSNAKYDNCDYFIRSGTSAGVNFDAADWTITNCEGHARIDHIIFDTIDGLTVSDNILFFPGYQTVSSVKRSHVRIETGGTWIHIHDNKFFESGGTSVYLNKCSRYSLHGNLYAFGAQRVPSAQIVVTGVPLAGDYFGQGLIHDETTVQCGGEGISIGAKTGRTKIHHNNIQNPSSPSFYYGAAAQPAAVGIMVDADTIAVEVCDNTTSAGTNQLAAVANNVYRNNVIDNILAGFGIRTESTIKTLAITSGTSLIDVTASEAVTVAVAASFGLATITNTGQTKVITITNTGTSSFNVVHSANLKLAGSVNATLTVGSSLTLRVANGGAATEVSRAII